MSTPSAAPKMMMADLSMFVTPEQMTVDGLEALIKTRELQLEELLSHDLLKDYVAGASIPQQRLGGEEQ